MLSLHICAVEHDNAQIGNLHPLESLNTALFLDFGLSTEDVGQLHERPFVESVSAAIYALRQAAYNLSI